MKVIIFLLLAFLQWAFSKKDHVSLLFVGDISLARIVRYYVEHHYHTYDDIFADVAPLTRAADVFMGNMESVFVTNDMYRYKSRHKHELGVYLDSDPASVSALRSAGFDVISLANNHLNDFGEEGVNFTTTVLRDAGIKPFGISYGKYDSGQEPVIIERKGIKIGFLGYWQIRVPFLVIDRERPSQRVNFKAGPATYDDKRAAEDIKKLKKTVDVIVVYMHWGEEFISRPFRYQEKLARYLMSLGVHVIVGSHSHTLQTHCLHGNKVVAYSLGNFLFPFPRLPGGNAPALYGSRERKENKRLIEAYERLVLSGSQGLRSSLLFRVNVTKNGVLGADYLPLILAFDKNKRFHPEPKKNVKWIPVCGQEDKKCQNCV